MTVFPPADLELEAPAETPAGVAIEVRDVTKRFRRYSDRRTNVKELFSSRRQDKHADDFWALKGVDLDIPRGKTFALIGHNGSGKSTLLKLVAGIHRPTSGTITAHGRISAMLELGAGFHPEMTGRENVYLNGSILGMTRKQIDAAMDEIIAFSGLEDFIDTPVKVYSSGMYVRLGFAIAVNLDPEILIVDEVIAVGDEEFQRRCFDHLYKLRRKGVTIVLVTHSLGLVTDLCDQAAWLDGGTLKAVGPSREVVDQYLKAVNQREAQTRPEPTAPAEGEENEGMTPRRGSGEIRVTDVEYLDERGRPQPFLATGQSCTIRMRYRASTALPSVTFGLGFTTESGIQVAGPNSGYGDAAFAVEEGEGHVDFTVDELPLQPGEFLVTTAAVDKGHPYDYLDRAFVLKVRAENVTEPGLVKVNGHWSHSHQPAAH
ncbi:ABC transporter ATP-binding protein [Blastococcus sp. SYSU D00669]